MKCRIQFIRDKRLRQFDYGKELNKLYYNSTQPPEYNISEIGNFELTSLIFGGDCDSLSDKEDFEYFRQIVSPVNKTFKFLKNYNHLDYLWGKEAVADVYMDVIDFIKNK
jgi:hypothetical protein